MRLRAGGMRSRCKWDIDIVKCNVSITNHMRDGCCDAALAVFSSMPRRSSVSYNAMINGYISNNQFNLARKLFDEMPRRDLFSWNVMLGGYLKHKSLSSVRAFFDKMPVKDVVSWNSMLSGYAQNGMIDCARQMFDAIPEKNNVSWNGLLSAYIQNGRMEEAKKLFGSKSDWGVSSWNCLMNGLVRKKKLAEAIDLFERIPQRDNVSWNIIVTGFAQNGEMEKARMLFDQSPVRDVFTWTAMVSGYSQNGMIEEARRVFDRIPQKNIISWNAMIAGYMHHNKMDMARTLFDTMPFRNGSSWNIMITGYAQSGDVNYAREFFDQMPHRDGISWSAMISGYAQSGYSEEALRLLIQYKKIGGALNRSSFASSIAACASIATLELGRQVHSLLTKSGFGSGCFIGNALLAMYFRCGSMEEARQMFDSISEKDIVSWNTIIFGYARHGFGHESLRIFDSMMFAGVPPDETTMVGVLAACGHAGLVEKGLEYFNGMKEQYGITATSSHYSCVVDLLGRAGRLEEARGIIRNMPFPADAGVWGALLGASRIYGNADIGEEAAEKVLELESENSGMYVLLSNIYADSRRWVDADRIRRRMKDNGVKKEAGHSWIEVRNRIHVFTVGDSVHPERDKIYKFLEEMDAKMRALGYVSSTKMVLHDVEEEEKELLLKYHSEKLAVAFGILSLPKERPIRVIKNLRVCEDCHNAIKLMSKIVGRLIILRDSNRFHHFKDGFCSCGDYW